MGSNIFQAEIRARESIKIIILSDSLADIKALDSTDSKLRLVGVMIGLNKLGEINNEMSDQLAREASSSTFIGREPYCGLSMCIYEDHNKNRSAREATHRWISTSGLKYSNTVLSSISASTSKRLLKLNRGQLKAISPFKYMLRKLKLSQNDNCRFCEEEPILFDPKSIHLRGDDKKKSPNSSISSIPATPTSTPIKVKVTQHSAMTVSVTHAQVSIATATTSTASNSAVVATITMACPSSPTNSSGSDADSAVNLTAMRRLHFKSARSSRTRGPSVPKVVVMGSSSTASTSAETTINTSTESASTLVTNVTATDTSETCDSLDMGDTFGQSEPLLSSFDEPQTSISKNSQPSICNMQLNEDQSNLIAKGTDPTQLMNYEINCSSYPPEISRTAPVTSVIHFPFDIPSSPKSVRSVVKNHSLFTFGESNLQQQKQLLILQQQKQQHQLQQQQQQQQQNYTRQKDQNQQDQEQQTQIINEFNKSTIRDEHEELLKKQKEMRRKEIINNKNDSNNQKLQHKMEIEQQQQQQQPPPPPKKELKTMNKFLSSIKNLSSISSSNNSNKDNKDKTSSNGKINLTPTTILSSSSSSSATTTATSTSTAQTSKKDSTSSSSNFDYDFSGNNTTGGSTTSGSGINCDQTMFPFDREAIDYERIQRECFTVENNTTTEFPFDLDNNFDDSMYADTDSPDYYDKKPYYDPFNKFSTRLTGAKLSDDQCSSYFQYEETWFQMSNTTTAKRSYRSNKKRTNSMHNKFETQFDLDAFSPIPSDKVTKKHQQQQEQYSVSKFDQIASKFNQIPPKSLDAFNKEHNNQLQNQNHSQQQQQQQQQQQHYQNHHHHHHHRHHRSNHNHHNSHQHQHQQQHHHHHHSSSSSSSRHTSSFNNYSTQLPPSISASSSSNVIPRETLSPVPNLRVDFFTETNKLNDTSENCHNNNNNINNNSSVATVTSIGKINRSHKISVTATAAAAKSIIHNNHNDDYDDGGGDDNVYNDHRNGEDNDQNVNDKAATVVIGISGAAAAVVATVCNDHDDDIVVGDASSNTIEKNGTIIVSTTTNPNNCGNGAINVTSNPMDTAVCTQPRATIVVQQASLSLDNTVETVLLKNEGEFISLEQGKDSSSRKQIQREENMRQLLDVTNMLTSEELRDFEMRYGSPHHCRSQSVKTPGSRASGRPNHLCLPQQRSRVASMPNTGVEEEYYRLRHFSITGKGVVNRGDSLKSKRSRSNNSVASSNSSTEHLTTTNHINSARTSATCSLASSRESSTSNPGNGPYKVLMLGGTAVGKSSLVSQFMTSEYLHAYDTSIDDESGEKSVSVLLSGEESELIFIDHPSTEMSPENCISTYDPHGYCVIYSSADRSSFMIAERVIQTLWTSDNIAQRAVILVGNKADLARSRVITLEEGKAMATAYDCKFIETSVGINHNVDELLVGLLSQIRLKLENPEKSRDLFRKRSCRKSKRRACSPLGSACLSGNGGTNPCTPVSIGGGGGGIGGGGVGGGIGGVGGVGGVGGPNVNLSSNELNTPPSSAQSSPRKYRGSRTSASLKVKGLLGRVWARDSKSKSCENLHVL